MEKGRLCYMAKTSKVIKGEQDELYIDLVEGYDFFFTCVIGVFST